MSAREVVILPDPAALAEEAARRFVACAGRAVAERGQFTVALSGGSTPAGLYRRLAAAPYRDEIDWERTRVFFGDERCVAPDHPDSNYHMAHETLLGRVPLPPDAVYRILGELEPPAAAAAYAATLRTACALREGSLPRFDLVLLGMGDDGHTASLFPGLPALEVTGALVVASEAPAYVRPQVPRVSLTRPVLDNARQVMFLVAGASKAGMARLALQRAEPAAPPPARRVAPVDGALVWLLDRAAAAELEL